MLVAAKYARVLNEFPRCPAGRGEKKLTTRALEELSGGNIEYQRRPAPSRRRMTGRGSRRTLGAQSGPVHGRVPSSSWPLRLTR